MAEEIQSELMQWDSPESANVNSPLIEKATEKEEKFQKLKDVYGNLRKEHINLLRLKADVEKHLNVSRQKAESLQKTQSAAEDKLQALLSERSTLEEGLQMTTTEKDSTIAALEKAKEVAAEETHVRSNIFWLVKICCPHSIWSTAFYL